MSAVGEGKKPGDQLLSRAIDAERRHGAGERLSPAGRDRLLGDALAPGRGPRPFAALFTPWARLVSAGVLPILVTGALLVLVGSPDERRRTVAVKTAKSGDFVVFTIANGDRTHFVTRSTRPDQFDPASKVPVTGGEFYDRAASEESLVFYRID